MVDYGAAYTDKEIKILESHIKSIYGEAKKDLNAKLKDFNARFKVKDAKHKADLKAGKITKDEYQAWLKGQVFQGDHWKQMKAQMESVLLNANQEAINIVNGGKVSVIAYNANYMAYSLEHTAGVNLGFALYDRSTVTNLLKNQPDLLPNKHVDPVKDSTWNRKKITRQVTQGILQGESTQQVADRLASTLSSQNMNSMLTTARTSMTSAQNVGRQVRLEEAKEKGIKLKKEWMCTLDVHARIAHRELDGQKVDVDKPFIWDDYKIMYPADPKAEAFLIYNCFTEDVDVATNCEIVRSYKHMYEGELYKFKTVNGVEFTCTPNHPILTSSGWVRAEMLHEGDDILVTGIGNISGIRRNGNINQIHSSLVALFNAFHRFGLMSRNTTLSVNFHGYVPTSDVEVVTKEWLLRDNGDFLGNKSINKFLLKLTDASFVCLGTFMKHFFGVRKTSFRFVSRKCKSFSFFWGSVSHTDVHGFRTISDRDVSIPKYTVDNLPTETMIRSELLDGLPREIFIDHIINVDVSVNKCHVYNLQTENGYYFVNSIPQNGQSYNGMYAIAKNCRCTMVADLEDYPEEYERYDNIDGEPVKKMTYKEWERAKGYNQPQKIAFTPAKSISEAEAYANEQFVSGGFNLTGKNVSYDGIELEVANRINQQLTDIYGRYNIEKLTSLESFGKRNKKLYMANKDAPMLTTNFGNIGLNSGILKSEKTLDAYNKEGETAFKTVMANIDKLNGKQRTIAEAYKVAGKSLVGNSVEDMITHEVGHRISYMTTVNKELADLQKSEWEQYAKHISGYANHSFGEYVAESFNAYYKGERKGLQPELVKIFDSLRR